MMKNLKWAVLVLFFILGSSQIGLAQQDPGPYYRAGNTFYAQQNYDKAISYYQYAAQLNPNFWQAYQALGSCYYGKGDKASALTNYQKSLAINPNNPQLEQFVQTLTPSPAPALPNSPVVESDAPISSAAAPANNSTPGYPTMGSNGGVNRNLPRQGKFVFEIQDSDWLGSWSDINDFTGETTVSNSTPYGVKLGLGLAYVFSPNFQLGIKFQGLLKAQEELELGNQIFTWNENAVGGAIEATATLPISDGINFIGSLEGGFYTLVGTTVTVSGDTGAANISGSAPGGMITAGLECLMDRNKSWALDFGLDYQFLTFSTLTDTPGFNGTTGTAFTLKDVGSGSNADFDFSGVGVFAAVRFF